MVLRQAIAEADWYTVEGHGGFDVVMEKVVQWEQETPASDGRERIDDFRLAGSRTWRRRVATLQTGGGARRWRTRWLTLVTTATLLSQRAKPSPLWSRLCPETRIGRRLARIARVGCDNRGGAAAGVSRRRPLRRAWRRRKWRERPHHFWRWCATGQGEVARMKIRTISPPRWGRSLHSDPWREGQRAPFSRSRLMRVSLCSVVACVLRYVSLCVFMLRRVPLPVRVSPDSRQRLRLLRTQRHLNLAPGCAPSWMRPSKNRRPQMTRGRERARPEHAHNPISPIGSTVSLPSRSTVAQEESSGSNDRRICPPTSRTVQWIPVQIEGYNGGSEAGLYTVSLL